MYPKSCPKHERDQAKLQAQPVARSTVRGHTAARHTYLRDASGLHPCGLACGRSACDHGLGSRLRPSPQQHPSPPQQPLTTAARSQT
eukprot:scaffold17369_cov70-Phaeocystis_antarctica.AAC.3